MKMPRSAFRFASALALIIAGACYPQSDWPVFGHDAGAQKYSPLTQITPQNVSRLKLAWKYSTASAPATDASGEPLSAGGRSRSTRARVSEISPLVIGNVMYITSPYNFAAALEPETGKELWKWEYKDYGPASLRGLTYWAGDRQSPPTVFFGTEGGFMIALNAKTGK